MKKATYYRVEIKKAVRKQDANKNTLFVLSTAPANTDTLDITVA